MEALLKPLNGKQPKVGYIVTHTCTMWSYLKEHIFNIKYMHRMDRYCL